MSKFLFLLFSLSILIPSIISQDCQVNQNFCHQCNPLTNLCIKCQYDVFTPNNSGGCSGIKKCSIGKNFCEECSEEGDLCKTCSEGYSPDSNGGCTYVQNCLVSFRGDCLLCESDYILIGRADGPRICKSLNSDDFLNCKTINNENGHCEQCEEGFYLNDGDKKCTETENCLESVYSKCVSCKNGYYLDHNDNNICKEATNDFRHCKETENGEKCTKCEEGYYFDEEGKCCNMNFCSRSQNFICKSCLQGYHMTENKQSCTKEENCKQGDIDSGVCLWCKKGYYLDNNEKVCKPNQDDDDLKYCIFFTDKCLACEEGYDLGKDAKCSNTKHCQKSEFGKCLICEEGYYYGIDNRCSRYEHCISSTFEGSCTECEDGYYFDSYKGACLAHEGSMDNCKVANWDGSKCKECKDDYYLLPSDGLCYSNQEEGAFYKCAETDFNGTRCDSCINGYFIGSEDYLCSPHDNCAVSEGGRCVKCDDTFYCLDLKKGSCEPNYEIHSEEDKFYFDCIKTNEEGTACEECYEDRLQIDGLCFNMVNCAEEQDGLCVKCDNIEGHIPFYCLNKHFGCVFNYKNKNCFRCDNDFNFDQCDECHEGYHFDENNQCVPSQ